MEKQPRRILFVAHSAVPGGAEYCLETTLDHLDRSCFAPTVIFPREGPMAEAARLRGLEVMVIPLCHWLYFQRDWWYWKNFAGRLLPNVMRLARLIRKHRIELTYTNTSAIFESAIAARIAGIPHVWHVHEVLRSGNAMEQSLPLGAIKGLIYRLSDTVVFESTAAQMAFEETSPGDRSVVIPNSLRLDSVEPADDATDARFRFGLDRGDEVVAFVGQFIDRKNPLLVLRAMDLLRHRSRLKCLFAGEGPLGETLRSEIGRLGLEDRCRMIGFQQDVRPVLRAADVLVLPSRQESFGLVLLEASAHGKPVVACRSEGPSEIVVPGQTGLLVPQDEPEALARAMEAMFDGTIDRRAMGAAGARHVAAYYAAAANTRRLEAIFLDVLSRRQPGQSPAGEICQPDLG